MKDDKDQDYYDVLQVSAAAEPETINRVFRLLAQRFHPDNQQTGDESRFRRILDAYTVLSDPEKRATYDVRHQQQRKDRWRLVDSGAQIENDYEMEQAARLTVLEALYTKRRLEQHQAGIDLLDLEKLIGQPREHLEFTLWYLGQKHFITRDDNSRMLITVEGADYLEESYSTRAQRKQLQAGDGK
jgi:curved DNA-binding protein CbpA